MSASGNVRAAVGLLRTRRVTLLLFGAAILAALLAGALMGTPSARSADTSPLSVTISGAQPVYLVHNGDTAQVGIELTTAGSQPLDRDVTVNYQTGGTLTVGNGTAAKTLPSTAMAGTDYRPPRAASHSRPGPHRADQDVRGHHAAPGRGVRGQDDQRDALEQRHLVRP